MITSSPTSPPPCSSSALRCFNATGKLQLHSSSRSSVFSSLFERFDPSFLSWLFGRQIPLCGFTAGTSCIYRTYLSSTILSALDSNIMFRYTSGFFRIEVTICTIIVNYLSPHLVCSPHYIPRQSAIASDVNTYSVLRFLGTPLRLQFLLIFHN